MLNYFFYSNNYKNTKNLSLASVASFPSTVTELKKIWLFCENCLSNSKCNIEYIKQCKTETLPERNEALNLAVGRANIEAVHFLVDIAKTDVNGVADEEYHETPLIVAAYYGSNEHQEIAKFLISRGANVNATRPPTPTDTALLTAIWKNNINFAKLLLLNGANPSLLSTGIKKDVACKYAIQKKESELVNFIPNCCYFINHHTDTTPEIINACKIKSSVDVTEADAKVKQLFTLYNNHNEHSLYQQFTDTLGAKVDENEFLIDLKNKHNTLGNLIKTKLIFSHSAYPNLIYLFYQSTYERTTLTEYFVLSRHHPMKELQFNTDYVDTHGILKNDETLDSKNKKAIMYIQTLRDLYNNSNYYSYYKNMDPVTTEGILSKDDFISKMTIQKNKLGKYISSKILFAKKNKIRHCYYNLPNTV